MIAAHFIGKTVLVRTSGAGVHIGTLSALENKNVLLTKSRRLWHWCGAFTLSAVAEHGISPASKLGCEVPEIYITDVWEIIPLAVSAIASVDACPIYIKSAT